MLVNALYMKTVLITNEITEEELESIPERGMPTRFDAEADVQDENTPLDLVDWKKVEKTEKELDKNAKIISMEKERINETLKEIEKIKNRAYKKANRMVHFYWLFQILFFGASFGYSLISLLKLNELPPFGIFACIFALVNIFCTGTVLRASEKWREEYV